jgi:FkbM family methyltransferase
MTDIARRVHNVEAQLDAAFGTPLWLRHNYTEPRVNYAVTDLVQPGWTTFDVGSNFGGITVALSRLVGPRGAVCGFEANPIIAARCQQELLRSGAFNAQLYSCAIYKRSGEMIDLFLSENQVADSIYYKTDRSIKVQTVALDDFVARTGLAPQFVKMDIEGAEADALVGFERTIDTHRPIMILEHAPPNNTCFDFLCAKGYLAIDLQNYRTLRSPEDVLPGTVVTDVLYAHTDKLHRTAYAEDLNPVAEATLYAGDFSWWQETLFRSRSLDLRPGRYLARLNFRADGQSNTMCGIWPDGEAAPIMRAHAASAALTVFARNMVFDTMGGAIHVFFQFFDTPDRSLAIDSVEILRVPGFERYREAFRISM